MVTLLGHLKVKTREKSIGFKKSFPTTTNRLVRVCLKVLASFAVFIIIACVAFLLW